MRVRTALLKDALPTCVLSESAKGCGQGKIEKKDTELDLLVHTSTSVLQGFSTCREKRAEFEKNKCYLKLE